MSDAAIVPGNIAEEDIDVDDVVDADQTVGRPDPRRA